MCQLTGRQPLRTENHQSGSFFSHEAGRRHAGATGSRVCVSFCPGINLSFTLRFAASCDSDGGAQLTPRVLAPGQAGKAKASISLRKEACSSFQIHGMDNTKHGRVKAHLYRHAYPPASNILNAVGEVTLPVQLVAIELTVSLQPPAPHLLKTAPCLTRTLGHALAVLVPSGER